MKLSTPINELVRLKLHELADMEEGAIRAIDQQGTGLTAVRLQSTYETHRRVLTRALMFNSLNSDAFTGCRERDRTSTVVTSVLRLKTTPDPRQPSLPYDIPRDE